MEMEVRRVLVCQYVNCLGNGSAAVLKAFSECSLDEVTVVDNECQGQCNMGPAVRIVPDEIWYCRVKPEDVPEIVDCHLKQGKPVERLLHPRFHLK